MQLLVFSLLVRILTSISIDIITGKYQNARTRFHFNKVIKDADNHTSLQPQIQKANRGRPKVAHIRTNYRVEKRAYNCSVCHQPGHTRRVCPNQPVEHGRAQRARDQLVEGKYIII
jgi:hypothetical protein